MKQSSSDIARWEQIALVAAVIILFSPAIYLFNARTVAPVSKEEPAKFVGSEKCMKCHEASYNKWRGSHHDLAMDVANDSTVLGNFNNASYTDPFNNVTSRFYRKGSRFFVETEGSDGRPGEFEITHTFGAYPLQQYLIPFPDGRLQCLNIAWDVDKKQWYRLPPYEVEGHEDWLHWTKGGQTWNVMCAECHSTSLVKGYDPDAGSYRTSWSEIDVGCEACHGPGSNHLKWADKAPLARTRSTNYDLTVRTGKLEASEQIRLCAPCHSRRFQLADNRHTEGELLDLMVPQLLNDGLYYPDGQILEEVYVYGSFVQSKMYRHNVRCSDCHDIHSLKLHKEKNELCTQCHRAGVYDSKAHHFHNTTDKGKPSDGYLCVKCHMPGRFYMGIDYRPDHSLRVPRPDLSVKIGTPNACSAQGCHADKPLSWSVEHYTKWYGETRKPHYGETLARGRAYEPDAAKELISLAEDSLIPAIVRATALQLLGAYEGQDIRSAIFRALDSEEALIRYAAIRSLENCETEICLTRIAPKLYDPVKAVRMEAAMMLSDLSVERLRAADQAAFFKALSEYRETMLYNADLAPQRYNLGNLAIKLGEGEEAVKNYKRAIDIDDRFYPAKVNLAMLYNSKGNKVEAEKLLREVVAQEPELYEVAYSLGLLLAEVHNFADSEIYLRRAAAGLNYGRAHYNHGQILLLLKQPREAERALLKALTLVPDDQDFFTALVNLYVTENQWERAVKLAQRLLRQVPGHTQAKELLRYSRN